MMNAIWNRRYKLLVATIAGITGWQAVGYKTGGGLFLSAFVLPFLYSLLANRGKA